ncbi:hypothetical protein FF041_35115 [Streptomyces jumonjinensis]|uniref:Uncharacterized protein n=1 Tax=Streptomyces jumonjinensis TaxID=1945 RepID=A0A646KVY4_STRJU|nr:hypothetical protein [Streptomyces jumonjinensis]
MPFQGGSNKRWILEELGDRIRPEWNRAARHWEIARPHLRTLVESMAMKFGEVNVYMEFSTRQRCDMRCSNAVGDDCVCSCMGENHGGAAYWQRWTLVGDTTLIGSSEVLERQYLVRRSDLVKVDRSGFFSSGGTPR